MHPPPMKLFTCSVFQDWYWLYHSEEQPNQPIVWQANFLSLMTAEINIHVTTKTRCRYYEQTRLQTIISAALGPQKP